MIIQKTAGYWKNKTLIDKAHHLSVAYKVEAYNNSKVDELVLNFNDAGVSSKPVKSMLTAELSILNKPEVYKNYNRIINSKFTSNDNFTNLLVKNKANKDLNRIVQSEVERITKNLDYVEKVMQTYEIQTEKYQQLVKQQKDSSIAHRQEILKQVAYESGQLLKSEGLNIPQPYSYYNLEVMSQSLLRQSQMTAGYNEAEAVNTNYINEGKNPIYTSKTWIHTHRGETTRHMSNHMQKVPFNEPFIVVNDKTLHIDEMMYPCDPAGSFQNAFICYCEVYYDDKGEYLDGVPKGTTYTTPSVTFANKLIPKKPVVPSNIPASVNVKPTMTGSNVVTGVPVKSYIDVNVDGVTAVPHNYIIDGTKVPLVLDNGKYYYNGLELNDYDYVTGKGKLSKKAVTKHNNNLNKKVSSKDKLDLYVENQTANVVDNNVTKTPFNIDELTKLSQDYIVDKYNADLTYDEITGKYYAKGLDVTPYYVEKYGWAEVPHHIIEEHNASLGSMGKDTIGETMSMPKTEVDNTLTGETTTLKTDYIDTSILEELDSESWFIDEWNNAIKNDLTYNKDGDYWEYKGLKVKGTNKNLKSGWIDKDVIEEHNKKVSGTENNVTAKVINVDEIPYLESTNEYMVYKSKLETIDGKTYYQGLDVTKHLNSTGSAYIPAEKIIDHNNKLGASTFIKPENETILTPNKETAKPIDTSTFEKLGDDFYIEFNGENELENLGVKYDASTDTYTMHGLKITKVVGDPKGFGAIEIPIDYIEDYNLKLGYDLNGNKVSPQTTPSERTHIRNSDIIRREKDSMGELYAVEENGTKYRIDKNKKAEREQDRLQEKIDMSEHREGMHGWAIPRYDKINSLVLGIKTYDYNGKPYRSLMQNEVFPLLDEIYYKVDNGKPLGDVLSRYEKLVDKAYEIEHDMEIETLLWDLVDMEHALAKSPALAENMMFIRDGHWEDAWNKVGEIFEFEPYSSTTYKETGAGFDRPSRYRITILAPEGTRGTRMNRQYGSLTGEREWLLKRHQRFEVLEFNDSEVYDAELRQRYKGTVTIRLIPD